MGLGNQQNKDRYVVGKIENNIIACENLDTGESIKFKESDLQSLPKEGEILKFDTSLNKLIVDKEGTIVRKEYISNLFDSLFDNKK